MDQLTIGGQSRAIVAGIAGNVMEWYDFSVYGYSQRSSDAISFLQETGQPR
jgi:hypothetical protein